MIDHVLGRPSVAFRKTQVFAVVSFWSLYLLRGNNHGPPGVRRISQYVSQKMTAFQTMVAVLLWLYFSRNFAKIANLESPEPLANLYSRSYFRATWVTTALDAGFWTAMKIRKKWLRDILSIVFSIYYLVAAEQADEKVRRVRATLTVEHLRVSWNKSQTPILRTVTALMRPKFTRFAPKKIRIPRPPNSSYKDPITAWLFYDAPFSTIDKHTDIILDIPGGGFVAMNPRTNDDKLFAWSGKTGLPIVSLDYKKAPEYPYPYALNECFDAYCSLMMSRGRCIGLSGQHQPRIIVTGDSAGGNLATGTVLMLIQEFGRERRENMPMPQSLILMYPGLDMNIGSWMTDEQMSLIQDRRTRARNRNVLRRKSEDYYKLDPSTPQPSDDEEDANAVSSSSSVALSSTEDLQLPTRVASKMAHINQSELVSNKQAEVVQSKPQIMKTRLATSSMISYFNDRILTPEMMRGMIILYVGPHARPDFTTDYLLSPILAPEAMLAQFPKTYFLTGERDPLVDDTVIFAGRIRQAKYHDFVHQKETGLVKSSREFNEREHVEVALVPGISHGFFQFVSVFPEGWKHIFRCARWMQESFAYEPGTPVDTPHDHRRAVRALRRERHHRRRPTESSGDEDKPLEMTPINGSKNHKPKRSWEKRQSPTKRDDEYFKRQQSTASLASEEDILARRMQGLAGGLMGMNGEEEGEA